MSTEANKAIMRRFWDELFTQGNTEVADEIVGADYLNHDPAPGEQPGRAGLAAFVAHMHAGFPDGRFEVERFVVEGDTVVTRWRATGTHHGAFMGIPATGRAVNITGVAIHRIADGRIVESWGNWDMLGLLQQLGVLPQPQSASDGDENKVFMQRFVHEVINEKNLDALDTLVADDFVEHVPFPGQGPGREGLRHVIGQFLTAFPDLHWALDEQIVEGDKVVSRFTWTGTHRGSFLGVAPTGRRVQVWGLVIDVVRGGQFAESRIIMDTLGLMQQLGALPQPAQA